MVTTDPVEQMRAERKKQREQALLALEKFAKNKIRLKRPVFFIPGWTDEDCGCWMDSTKTNPSIKDWLLQICSNPAEARYVNFEKESPRCKSFLDFGRELKKKIWADIGKTEKLDVVGHSMGGLTMRAAVTFGKPLTRVQKCITVATPHQGDHFGGMDSALRGIPLIAGIVHKLKPETKSQRLQGLALDPDHKPIKLINTAKNRTAFLKGIGKLYQFGGTRDFTVKGSAYFDQTNIAIELCKRKITKIEIPGADHTGKIGITQDPRTVLAIIQILLGINAKNSQAQNNNKGIFISGSQAQNNNKGIFISGSQKNIA